jgi:hypothetical protein
MKTQASKPFDIPQAQDALFDVLALANAAKAMCGSDNDGWRVLHVLGERLLSVINRLEELDNCQREEAAAALNSVEGYRHG